MPANRMPTAKKDLLSSAIDMAEKESCQPRQPRQPRQPCRLLEIPPELRLAIYEQCFEPGFLELYYGLGLIQTETRTHPLMCEDHEDAIGLLTTCKKIRDEALPILWANLNVHFSSFALFGQGTIRSGAEVMMLSKKLKNATLSILPYSSPARTLPWTQRMVDRIDNAMPNLQTLRITIGSGLHFYELKEWEDLMRILSSLRFSGRIEAHCDQYSSRDRRAMNESYKAMLRRIGGYVRRQD